MDLTNRLDNSFEQNLAAFVEANASSTPSDFKAKRELDIARDTLEEANTLTKIVVGYLKEHIKKLIATSNSSSPSGEDLMKLITLANTVEERSHRLTQNCKTVAGIAKTNAEIESLLSSKLDVLQVYSVISQLPQILLSLILSSTPKFFDERKILLLNSSNGDHRFLDNGKVEGKEVSIADFLPNYAETLVDAFNDEIERSVNVLTYKNSDNQNSCQHGGGIIESQVVAMLNSVPIDAPTVVPPSSELANIVNNH